MSRRSDFRSMAPILISFCLLTVLQGQTDHVSLTPAELLRRSAEYEKSLPSYAMRTETVMKMSSPRDQTTLWVYDQRFDRDRKRVDATSRSYAVIGDQKHLDYEKRGIWTGEQFQWRQQFVSTNPGPVQASGAFRAEPAYAFLVSIYSGAFLSGILEGNDEHVCRILEGSDRLKLRDQMETVGEDKCHVIEGQTTRGYYRLWIDPAHGFTVRKALHRKQPGDLHFGKPIESPSTTEHKLVDCQYELDNVRIEKIGDYYVPMSGELTSVYHFGDGVTVNQKWVSKRSGIQLAPDFEAIGAFVMDGIPEGTTAPMEDMPGLQFVWSHGRFVVDTAVDEIRQIDDAVDSARAATGTGQAQIAMGGAARVHAAGTDERDVPNSVKRTAAMADGRHYGWITCAILVLVCLVAATMVVSLSLRKRSS